MPEPKFHQKIAWFNFICCLMVIWTHSGNADLFFPELGQDAPWWHFQYPVMQEILRVDIPCFIMLSAYLFYRNFTMKRLGEKLNKRLHSLLVPYLLWNTIYYVAYVAASRIPGLQTIANRTDLVITPSGAWQAITKYTFNPVFWFMYQIILLVLLAPVLQLVKATPVASFIILALVWVRGASLSVLISFLMVLPVLYGAVRTGIGSVDVQLLEMAKVFRLPLGRRLRAIWLPAVLPAFRQGCSVALGICWKSGVAAEVIGLPDGSIGDALYRAKITLSTGELFAWTFVIILLSAVFEKLFLALLDRAVARVLGEEGV